jgi:hypothetical protein
MSVESSVVPVSAHYVDAPKDLDYHSVPANGKVALVTVRGAGVGGTRWRGAAGCKVEPRSKQLAPRRGAPPRHPPHPAPPACPRCPPPHSVQGITGACAQRRTRANGSAGVSPAQPAGKRRIARHPTTATRAAALRRARPAAERPAPDPVPPLVSVLYPPHRLTPRAPAGQDGSYLAEFLLMKGYIVYGMLRRSSSFNTGRIEHLYQDRHGKAVR